MLGAVIGDIVGSPYEFGRDRHLVSGKDFPLFRGDSDYTDDSIMVIAVAETLMEGHSEEEHIRAALARHMQKRGREFPTPKGGYGGRFGEWLFLDDPEPYGSWGNGSAMRVAAAGWREDSLEGTEHLAELTASVTHDHPEGIKGAQATAAAIYLARTGHSQANIRDYIEHRFDYDLSRTLDDIRPTYDHRESCQETVPESIIAFLEARDFEDAIRGAISLGGDTDTMGAITGAIAEAAFGIPALLRQKGKSYLPLTLLESVTRFEAEVPSYAAFLAG